MAKIETAADDVADYLNTAEDVIAYIDAYREDGSPEETRRQCALSLVPVAFQSWPNGPPSQAPALPKRLAQPQLRPSTVYGASCTRLVCG